MSRIAVIDLLFNWPPDGGARTDIKEVANRLSQKHHICMFVPDYTSFFPRGRILNDRDIHFPIRKISFNSFSFNFRQMPAKFKKEVDSFHPDYVFIADGWQLKPHLVNKFKEYNVILRFYAYEFICLLDHGILFRRGKICQSNALDNPIKCLLCSLFRIWHSRLHIQEYLAALAFLPTYRRTVMEALGNADTIIVYNDYLRKILSRFNNNVHVVPSGVDSDLFKLPNQHIKQSGIVGILMAGRISDPLKGFSVLNESCRQLWQARKDFRLIATADRDFKEEYIISTGWLNQDDLRKLYQKVDICVIPSIWAEPFGIVAAEAMAMGKPVIATRVGGLSNIIGNANTGLLVAPDNACDLTLMLRKLVDDSSQREKLGRQNREKARREFDWDIVIRDHYSTLFQGATDRAIS